MKKNNINNIDFPYGNHLRLGLGYLLRALCLPLILTATLSCSVDDNGLDGKDPDMEVRFTAGADISTRAAEKNWDTGDRIGLFMVHSGQKLSSGNILNDVSNNIYTASQGHNVALTPADESQRIFYPSDGSRVDFIAYYPYRAAVVKQLDGKPVTYVYDIDLTDQSVPQDIDLLYSNNAVYKDHNAATVGLEFEHMLSRLRMNVIPGDGISDEELADLSIVISNVALRGEFSLTEVNITPMDRGSIELLSLSSGTVHSALMIPTPEGEKGRMVTFTMPEYGQFVWEMPDAAPLLQGKTHNYNVTVTREGIESVTEGDITEWNGKEDKTILGDALSGDYYKMMEAPNCYVVAPGGTVTIGLDKVFAVWENNPYLKNEPVALEGPSAAAYVYWKDSPDVKGTVMLTGEEIEVGVNSSSVHGNMVVAYSVDDLVLWSWHIWVTDYDPEDASTQKHNNGYVFLDRNLGAISNTPGDFRSTGLYYQWGRKDPMIGAVGWSSYSFAPMYEDNGSEMTRTTYSVPTGVEAVYLAYSINNPATFMGSSTDWFSNPTGQHHDRWNGGMSFKSAFDPCPEGWRVPHTGSGEISPWYGVTRGSMDDYRAQNGWDLDEAGYYPQTGFIQFNGTSIQSVGGLNNHYIWSATPYSNSGAHCLSFGLALWNVTGSTSIATGVPVRCVKQ